MLQNVVYGSSRPRAEVDGQAILVDVRNKLKTVLNFGPLKGARNKVLRRNDAVHGFIYDCRNNQVGLARPCLVQQGSGTVCKHCTARPRSEH